MQNFIQNFFSISVIWNDSNKPTNNTRLSPGDKKRTRKIRVPPNKSANKIKHTKPPQ